MNKYIHLYYKDDFASLIFAWQKMKDVTWVAQIM